MRYIVCGCEQCRLLFIALERADAIAKQADIVAAMSLEVLKGTTKAFDKGWQPYNGFVSHQDVVFQCKTTLSIKDSIGEYIYTSEVNL